MSNAAAFPPPNPDRIMALITGFEQTAALDAAVELDLFTAIGSAKAGKAHAAALAATVKASERGVAILADCLTVVGLLTKQGDQYALAPDAATFLDRRSPACIATVANWYGYIARRGLMAELTAAVRRGGADPQAPPPPPEMWTTFARTMAPMMRRPAELVAEQLGGYLAQAGDAARVLDLAGGHGLYGIAVARRYRNTTITLVDAEPVAALARQNAEAAGVGDRYRTLPGSILPGTPDETPLGEDYRLVLITGFLHMLGPDTIGRLLTKARAALAPGGKLIVTDFIVNDDRISPPAPALFNLGMLAATPTGQSYSMAEFELMFTDAGFASLQRHDLPGTPLSALVATR